jgi:lipopolysaccharide export system protein LptA
MKKKGIKYLYPTIIILLIALVIYIVKASDSINIIVSFLPEKIATLENVHMSGIEGSDEAWEVRAKEAWTGQDRNTTTLEFVTSADIIKNGKTMIKNLQARRMRISKNKDIEIFRQVPEDKINALLWTQIDFNAFSHKPKKHRDLSTLTADDIKFNATTRTGSISGHIKIVKGDLITRSEMLIMDLDNNIATFETRTLFTKGASALKADHAVAYFDEDRIDLSGSVEVKQKNKSAFAPAGTYDDNDKNIILTGKVKAVIAKLKDSMKKDASNKYRSDEANSTLTTRTSLECDKLVLSADNSDAKAYGNVHVVQASQEALSDAADYSDKDDTIIMTGNVKMKKNGTWITADKAIVYVDKKIFEAIGGVETTINIKKGKRVSF